MNETPIFFGHFIFVTLGGIKISSIAVREKANFSIVCKLEFFGISTFVRIPHEQNACPHIFVTLGGIEISSITERKNANSLIVCKL